MLSTLAIGCDRGGPRTDRDPAFCVGRSNNWEGCDKGCERRINGVKRGGVVQLVAVADQTCAVSLHGIQLSNRTTIVALSEPEPDIAAVVCRGRRGEILAEGSARGREIVIEILPEKVASGIDLR